MNKKRQYRDFTEVMKDKLQNPEFAIAYLNEALANEDRKVFLLALKDVIEARGDIASFAEAAHISRQNIYRILSEEGNPTLDSLSSIFNAMGLQMNLSLRMA